jgi:nucleoside-diphosphate-sugar epimerase
MPATEFWASQRVLLTGHTGFKGSWLSLWLEALGSRVFGFALPPDQTPSLYSKIEPINRLHSIIGDVRDVGAVKQASTWRAVSGQTIVSAAFGDMGNQHDGYHASVGRAAVFTYA